MSDFLGRLAGRSMGIEPVVQPAIPASTAPVAPDAELVEYEAFRETEQTAPVQSPDHDESVREARQKRAPAEPVPVTAVRSSLTTDRAAQEKPEGMREEPRRQSKEPSLARTTDDEDAARTLPPWDGARPESAISAPQTAAVRRQPDHQQPSHSAAPIVRVTIGRVEVRADMSGVKPRTSATPRPKSASVSLDDYLKQRAEGRR